MIGSHPGGSHQVDGKEFEGFRGMLCLVDLLQVICGGNVGEIGKGKNNSFGSHFEVHLGQEPGSLLEALVVKGRDVIFCEGEVKGARLDRAGAGILHQDPGEDHVVVSLEQLHRLFSMPGDESGEGARRDHILGHDDPLFVEFPDLGPLAYPFPCPDIVGIDGGDLRIRVAGEVLPKVSVLLARFLLQEEVWGLNSPAGDDDRPCANGYFFVRLPGDRIDRATDDSGASPLFDDQFFNADFGKAACPGTHGAGNM